MSLAATNAEFWGDLQADLYVENSAVYLANTRGESLISEDGTKMHRPLMSHAQVGTYTPHGGITHNQKTATDQELTVDTFKYASDIIDDTEKSQTPYSLPEHSSRSIRKALMNEVEQEYLSEIANARHAISGGAVALSSSNVVEKFSEATGILGSFDAPATTEMRAAVLGPKTIAELREAGAGRETGLGDRTYSNGIVGPMLGWTVVENNNLPWSATLTIATQPTEGDTVTIAGVTFTFKASPSAAGDVDLGANVAETRAHLKAAVEGGSGEGSDYIDLDEMDDFILRRKRNVACTSDEAMAFTGFGDIVVAETFTDGTDAWSAQQQSSVFMVRGAIDMVLQLKTLEFDRDPDGFGDIVKGLIGVGTKTFDDGAMLMVKMTQDVSGW